MTSFQFIGTKAIQRNLPVGVHLVDISGDQGITTAFSNIVKTWRKRALELGQNKYLEIPKLFL